LIVVVTIIQQTPHIPARVRLLHTQFFPPGPETSNHQKKVSKITINMAASNALLDSLKSANLLPSAIILSTFTPTLDLSVKFSSSGLSPENGSLARVSQVKEQPIISVSSSTSSNSAATTYTFMMIDPDAPTPDDPKFGYWRHWVVASIPSSSVDDIAAEGKTLTPYLAPGPKDESGPHRYLFLLFAEKAGGERVEKGDVGGDEFVERRSFRAEDLVAKKGLELVGVQWMRGVGDGWNGGKDEL
jgi:phosphatidylethanolamine-binding protein (PEBP) family uncharacterized protein